VIFIGFVCTDCLQGFDVVSAEILQFYFGEKGGSREQNYRTAVGPRLVEGPCPRSLQGIAGCRGVQSPANAPFTADHPLLFERFFLRSTDHTTPAFNPRRLNSYLKRFLNGGLANGGHYTSPWWSNRLVKERRKTARRPSSFRCRRFNLIPIGRLPIAILRR